ncbi:MAG: alpha amylase catalytic subunit [Spirochaetales bacterium]|nr:alpha amylase catalytic subunit [Spirochaetales bacterium]
MTSKLNDPAGTEERWTDKATVYHAYALGYCGAPERNDLESTPVPRLRELTSRLDRIAALGADTLLVGPLWESSSHGYDTVAFGRVDRRLGTEEDLRALVAAARDRGLRVMLDAVLNHVGREHPWFRDLRTRREDSPFRRRFAGLDFSRPGPRGDGFDYEGWAGCHDLVKLEHRDEDTRRVLIGEVVSWIRRYGISGLRLDAADVIERDFLSDLASACRAEDPEFWLVGEMVHGDYRDLVRDGGLDAVTNYECYKGLWSSLNDANYHEIAWSLERQFGESGIYRGIRHLSFVDNHDVDRAASKLAKRAHLYPLHALLFAMPGTPAIYYGSELGAEGVRANGSDRGLRRPMAEIEAAAPEADLARAIARFAAARRRLPALRLGAYRQLHVAAETFAFERRAEGSGPGSRVLALFNASDKEAEIRLEGVCGVWEDALDRSFRLEAAGGALTARVPPNWTRWLVAT